jgi:hypothetical protein
MSIVTTSMLETVLLALARIHKFLHYELTLPLKEGREVFEPQRDWAVLVDSCASLNSVNFVLDASDQVPITTLVARIQGNLNGVVDFFRQIAPRVSGLSKTEHDAALTHVDALIAKTERDFEHDAAVVRSALASNVLPTSVPSSISSSLSRFQRDHPRSSEAAFLMMRFSRTKLHDQITSSVRAALKTFSMAALRADDKEYHDELFPNIQTYMHGCGFGIAIFERIEEDDFNPNVSLEVGYMTALGKPVLLLKDRTLKVLHADLIGKLYKVFDSLDPEASIAPQIEKLIQDKSLAV